MQTYRKLLTYSAKNLIGNTIRRNFPLKTDHGRETSGRVVEFFFQIRKTGGSRMQLHFEFFLICDECPPHFVFPDYEDQRWFK